MSDTQPPRPSALDWPARRPWLTIAALACVTLLALVAVMRMRVNTSLDVLFARHDPASRALAGIITRFNAIDSLMLMASLPEGEAATPQASLSLLAFADRFTASVKADKQASAMAAGLEYEVAPASRQFMQEVALPNLALYLDDGPFEQLRHRLTPEGMAERFARNEAMMAAPGAGGALAKVLMQDPLALRELAIARLARMAPPLAPYQGLAGDRLPFISPDGRHLLVIIAGTKPVSDMAFVRDFTQAMERHAQAANMQGLTLEWTGGYAIAREAEQSIRSDMIASTITSIVLIQLLFLVAYRHLACFPLTFTPIAMGMLWGFGACVAMGLKLTAPVAVTGAMLAGMAIDYALHYLSHHHQAGQPIGATRRLIRPLMAAFITTAAGFAVIALSDVQALRDFALLGILGLTGSLLATLTLLPATLSLLHRGSAGRALEYGRPRLALGQLYMIAARKPGVTLGIGLALVGVALLAILSSPWQALRLESNLRTMHPQPNHALAIQDRITERFKLPPEFLVVHLRSDSSAHLVSLSARLREKLSRMPREAGLVSIMGLSDLLPDEDSRAARDQALAAIDPQAVLADFRHAAQDSLFDPAGFKPYEAFLEKMLRPGDSPTLDALRPYPQLAGTLLPRADVKGETAHEALTYLWLDTPLQDRAHRHLTIDLIRQALIGVAQDGRREQATLTGMSVVAHDTEFTIARDLVKLSGLAVICVVVILRLTFRRWRDVLLALLPVMASGLAVLTLMRLTHMGFNLINIIGLPLLAGVSVDYGIFLVSAGKQADGEGPPSIPALLDRLRANSHASMMCCFTTLLGFGSVVTVHTPALASLGWVLSVGMVGCLAGAILLTTPALLLRHRRQEDPS